MGSHRVTQETVEVLATGVGRARTTQKTVEALTTGQGPLRATQQAVEVLITTIQRHRVTQQAIETLCNVPLGSILDVTASNTLNLSQSASFTRSLSLSVGSVLSLISQAARINNVSTDNILVLSQTASAIKFKSVFASNTITLTQSVERGATYNRGVSQGVGLAQNQLRNLTNLEAINQQITLVHVATGVETKKSLNQLVLSQEAEATVGKRIQQSIELTAIAQTSVSYARALHSNFIPFQVLSVSATIRRNPNSNLTLMQIAVADKVRLVKNNLTINQLAAGVQSKPSTTSLTVGQTVKVNKSSAVRPENVLVLGSSVVIKKSRSIATSNALGMTSRATVRKVISVSVGSGLAIGQNLVRTAYPRPVAQSLAVASSAVASKRSIRSASNAVKLTQSVAVTKTIVRSVGSSLVFKQTHKRFSGSTSIEVPNVSVAVPRQFVFLTAGTRSITLPVPEFDDSESGTGQVHIKRTMTGGRFVYKRRSPTDRLVYTFVIDRDKLLELRRFVIENNSEQIAMENWKGEKWSVKLTNNPFSFSEDAHWSKANKSSITLEFEGVKLN